MAIPCLCWVNALFIGCCCPPWASVVAVEFLMENVSAGWPMTQRDGDALGEKAEMGGRKELEKESLGACSLGKRGSSCRRGIQAAAEVWGAIQAAAGLRVWRT